MRLGKMAAGVKDNTCPRIDYTDRGKREIELPREVRATIEDMVEKVTHDWCAQRKREERDRSARAARLDHLTKVRKISTKEAAWSVMEAAYNKVSGPRRLPANARQIMYAARPTILEMTGKAVLNDKYFTQTLLVDFMTEHPDVCADWDIKCRTKTTGCSAPARWRSSSAVRLPRPAQPNRNGSSILAEKFTPVTSQRLPMPFSPQ
jgi:hypothetical protein